MPSPWANRAPEPILAAIPPGRVVILNGAPRSGKSTIARAMQETLPGLWLNLGVDWHNASLPPALRPGIGLRPGRERPELEPLVTRLFQALYDTIAAHARQGFDVVADLGHHDGYSAPLGILPRAARQLQGLDGLLVGVHCPIETIMARRNADPQNGLYATGPGVPEPVQRWQDAVHQPGIYDLELDTSVLSPPQCVAAIAEALSRPKTALHRLAQL